jgi:hypothetical protein
MMSLSVAMAMITSGCGNDDGGGGSGTPGIEELVSDLRVSGRDDLVATLMPGSPPAASGGPVVTAPSAATVNPSITVGPVPITSTEEFSTLLLEIPGSTGYWVLDFGSLGGGSGAGTQTGGTEVSVDVTFGDNPPDVNFDCLFSGSEGGAVGPPVVTTITIQECTVRDFCEGSCDPDEAAPCREYCTFASALPSCVLDANAPLVCSAAVACSESATCADAGQCSEEQTDGAISADCAESVCEALESLP